MVTGSATRTRAILSARILILSAGVFLMVVPFAYMFATSLKPNALVLEIPPKLIPHPATTANYTDAWTSNKFGRYFLNSLGVAIATSTVRCRPRDRSRSRSRVG